MATDDGVGEDGKVLSFKDKLGPKEKKAYDITIDFLSPDKRHAGVAAITRVMDDDFVRRLTNKPDLSESDAQGKRWEVVELVNAELQRRNPDAVATQAELNTKIAETGLQPYMDIVNSMPVDASYSAHNISGLMELNTAEYRGKGMNLAHRQFAHTMGALRDAVIANNYSNDGTQVTPVFVAKTEIGVVAVAQFLEALDQAFTSKGMKPFSVDSQTERGSGSWGDSVLQYLDNYIDSIPAGRDRSPSGAGIKQILREVSAKKRVNALAPRPESPITPSKPKTEGPFINAFERARLARVQADLAKQAGGGSLDNSFDIKD